MSVPVAAPKPIRLLPVPRSEPMPDEEPPAAGVPDPQPLASALPLVLPTPTREPSFAPPPRSSRRRAEQAQTDSRPERLSAHIAVRCFLVALIEVVRGYRPATQLRALCRPDRYAAIAEQITSPYFLRGGSVLRGGSAPARAPVAGHASRKATAGHVAGNPPARGMRPTRPQHSAPNERIEVRRVQICAVLDDVAEAAVVLARREHVWAMAIRMERVDTRWLCAHLEVITPPPRRR